MRYFAFGGDTYYPTGGWKDFISAHSTLEDALTAVCNHRHDWWHIVDINEHRIVRSGCAAHKERTMKQIGWIALCDKTGGRIFEYTEEQAKEQGRSLYGEHGFKVAPLYVTDPLPGA